MKLFRFLFSILILSSLVVACVDEYNEPEDYSTFEGSFTLQEVYKTIDGKLQNVTEEELGDSGLIKSVFIQIRDSLIITYKNGLRDSAQLYSYYLDDIQHDIFISPIQKDTTITETSITVGNIRKGYTYYGTYTFTADSLHVDKYPVRIINNTLIIDRDKAKLECRTYIRPSEK